MKAVLLHGPSHGHMLHRLPDEDPPHVLNVAGTSYRFVKLLLESPTTIALYAHGKPMLPSPNVQLDLKDWIRLLADPSLFDGSGRFKRKRPSRTPKLC